MRTELRRELIDIGNAITNTLGKTVLNGKCFYRKIPQWSGEIASGTLIAGVQYKVVAKNTVLAAYAIGQLFTAAGTEVMSATDKVITKTAYPYMMFFFVTITSDRDTANEFETPYLQLNLYDKMENLSVLEYLMNKFRAGMVKGNFTMNSHVVDSITHQFDRDVLIDDVVQLISQYKIDLTVT